MNIKERLNHPMIKNFLYLALLQGVNYILPLISYPYLFRTLGVERWGLVSFGYAFMYYFVTLTDFGFNLSGTKYISQNRDNLSRINSFLNSAMICRAVLLLLSFIILLTISLSFNELRLDTSFYLLYFGVVLGNMLVPVWFFQGMEQMKYMTLFNLLSKGLSIIPFFIFVHKPEDYIYVPVFYSFGFIMAGAISLYFVCWKMGMSWFIPPVSAITKAFKDSATYFMSRVSLDLFSTSNSLVIKLVLGNTACGYYSAAEKLYKAYNSLLMPFVGVLFPHIAKVKDAKFFKKVYFRVTSINVFVIAVVWILAEYIIYLVYGNTEIEVLNVFRILILACFVSIPSMLLGYPFLAAMGHPKYTNWTMVLTSITHISLLIILFIFGKLSLTSVACMVVFSETSLFIYRRIGVLKFGLFKKDF